MFGSGCNTKQKNVDGLLPRQLATDKATSKELKKAESLQVTGCRLLVPQDVSFQCTYSIHYTYEMGEKNNVIGLLWNSFFGITNIYV